MSKFFVEQNQIGGNHIEITDEKDIHHISKVLRLKVGALLDISDSTNWEYRTEIISLEKDLIKLLITDKHKFAREPDLKITLFQGLPKQGKMEVIIQKAVELGVFQIVPVFTQRSVVTDNGKMDKKILRWQKISDEAVKQCKRGIVPEIKKDISFNEMINLLDTFDLVLFPYENEDERTIKDALRNLTFKPKNLCIIIGPEGGFSEKEAKSLKEKNAQCITLGKTILRTETAGIAAIAMAMYELEL